MLRSEAQRPRQKPIRTWKLWAEIVAEQLASPNRPTALPARPADPNDPVVDFGGGFSSPISTIRKVVARGSWVDGWGPRYDQPGCRLPQFLIDEFTHREIAA